MSRLQRKKGRKSNYVKSLDNANHREAKSQALLRDNFKCKRCPRKIFLEYHHIDYKVLGKELEGDNLKWTVTLCDNCHELVHSEPNHKWNPKNINKLPFNA